MNDIILILAVQLQVTAHDLVSCHCSWSMLHVNGTFNDSYHDRTKTEQQCAQLFTAFAVVNIQWYRSELNSDTSTFTKLQLQCSTVANKMFNMSRD